MAARSPSWTPSSWRAAASRAIRSTASAWVRVRPAQTVAIWSGRCWTKRCSPWVRYTATSRSGGSGSWLRRSPDRQGRTALRLCSSGRPPLVEALGGRPLPVPGGGDELPDDGVDLGLPARPAEDAVVADLLLQVVALALLGDAGAQRVGRLGLAGRADVVVRALHGEQRGVPDADGVDALAPPGELPAGEVVLLEDAADGLQVELGGGGHDRARPVGESAG